MAHVPMEIAPMQRNAPARLLSPRTSVLIAMVAIAVGMRLIIWYVPGVLPYNFTPVEAVALFGGAYFVDRRLAFIVPLAAMVLADVLIALSLSDAMMGYWYRSVPAVYACIAVTVFGGFGLRNRVNATRVAGYSFASAVLFFLVTNFSVWLFAENGGGADACTLGLMPCYIAAIPFFKGTLLGTLLWSAALFGGFELMRRRWPVLQMAHA
jgi:hypothetical protein